MCLIPHSVDMLILWNQCWKKPKKVDFKIVPQIKLNCTFKKCFFLVILGLYQYLNDPPIYTIFLRLHPFKWNSLNDWTVL
jgi:hypothetical protein